MEKTTVELDNIITKEFLLKYSTLDNKIYISKVAKVIGCDPTTVRKRVLKLGFVGVNRSEALTGFKQSEEHIKNRSTVMIGKVQSEETKLKRSKSMLGKKLICKNPEERSKKLSLAMKGISKHTEESKKKIGLKNSKPKPPRTKEHQERLNKSILKAVCASPNKFEVRALKYVNSLYDNKVKYTGDGSLIINGKSADAELIGEKLVFLFNGCYYHLTLKNLEITEENKRIVEQYESLPFLQAGYKVVFIWEDEINKLLKVFEEEK